MDKTYYHEMLKRDRLIPIIQAGHITGFITYFIGASNNVDKYVRDNPWTILDDDPTTGDVCYIDQLITDKTPKTMGYNLRIFNMMVDYIAEKYPQVQYIRWNRYKNTNRGERNVIHIKGIRR